MTKVALRHRPHTGFHNHRVGPRPSPVTAALPIYCGRSSRLQICHRVRDGWVFWSFTGDRLRSSHVAVGLWCGQGGYLVKGHAGQRGAGWLVESVPDGWTMCARCEAKAP